LGTASGLAVLAYVFNAIGPTVDQEWMASVSPFGWYLGGRPLFDGFDVAGLLQLAAIPVVAGAAGLWRFTRRDLMV
jgi:ABC-2 type transport system permease protein